MSTKCLVRKFYTVVDNDNLDYLDKVKLTIKLRSGFPSAETNALYFISSVPIEVVNLNTDGASVRMDGGYLAITKGSSDTVNVLVSKYAITSITAFNDNVGIKLEQAAKFYDVKNILAGTAIEDSMANITDFRVLEKIVARNYTKANVDIGVFSEVPSIKHIELHYCNTIEGDLSSIKDMPNLETVILDHTYVKDKNDAVTYMQNRGITVTYTPYSE